MLFCWAGLLALLAILHAVWSDGRELGPYLWGYAVAVVFACGVAAVAYDRRTLRRGAPERDTDLDVVSEVSFGAVLLGVAAALTLFGQAFGNALTYIGFGLMALAFGRLVVETLAMRRAYTEATQRTPTSSSGGTGGE